jgi:hypothetical protein
MVVNIAKITSFPCEKNPFRKTGVQKIPGGDDTKTPFLFARPPFLGGGRVCVAKGDAQVNQNFAQKRFALRPVIAIFYFSSFNLFCQLRTI